MPKHTDCAFHVYQSCQKSYFGSKRVSLYVLVCRGRNEMRLGLHIGKAKLSSSKSTMAVLLLLSCHSDFRLGEKSSLPIRRLGRKLLQLCNFSKVLVAMGECNVGKAMSISSYCFSDPRNPVQAVSGHLPMSFPGGHRFGCHIHRRHSWCDPAIANSGNSILCRIPSGSHHVICSFAALFVLVNLMTSEPLHRRALIVKVNLATCWL